MGRFKFMSFLITGMAVLLLNLSVFGDDVPAWLRQAASVSVPAIDKGVRSLVLLDESRKTVSEDGKTTTINTFAVRILSREGRGDAIARVIYNTDSEKVKEIRAWLIRPGGEIKNYGKKEAMDVALADNDVYNEARARVISAVDDADAGCVFGYEIVTEEKTVFSQFVWYFQGREPVLQSRVTVSLPEGWRAEGVTFNHPAVEPVVNGSSYVWEVRDLPRIVREPAGPEIANLAPRVAISIFPPAGKPSPLRTFSSWKDVSQYTSELSNPQVTLSDAISAKVAELTARTSSEYERIRAIGRYAQSVNYISIQIGTGRGGGYRPHSAVDVFSKNYGDCKDKANLMRAMLKALRIEAYPVIIYSGDPSYVRSEWPSPHQFNHCIIGVKVSEETEAATIIEHPSLGRLLIFDPTDDHTPVGDLPDYLQGSLALIAAGEDGDLVRMPVTPPEANRLERTVEATLDPDGAITAKVSERSFGQAAVAERRLYRRGSGPQYLKLIERWITEGATGAKVTGIDPVDEVDAGKFSLDVEFSAPGYAKLMRDRLMVFKPVVVSRRTDLFLSADDRKHPIVLEAEAYTESARIKLPPGFDVDELPESDEINYSFGNYAVRSEVRDGYLTFKRSLILKNSVVPADKYKEVRNFYDRIRKAEQAPVVLIRK